MTQPWSDLLPLVRPQLMRLLKVSAVCALLWIALWTARHFLSASWQQSEAEHQAAEAQLAQAQQDQADVQAQWPDFQKMVAAGMVGGEPRAPLIEDLLSTAQALGLTEQPSFTLAAPEPVELPQAEAAQASVQRHVLDLRLTPVHETEALSLIEQLRRRHAQVARVNACAFERAGTLGLTVQCQMSLLHIDPQTPPANSASDSASE